MKILPQNSPLCVGVWLKKTIQGQVHNNSNIVNHYFFCSLISNFHFEKKGSGFVDKISQDLGFARNVVPLHSLIIQLSFLL